MLCEQRRGGVFDDPSAGGFAQSGPACGGFHLRQTSFHAKLTQRQLRRAEDLFRDGREESMPGTVAVYGASGYTGGLVAKALAARRYQVVLGGRAPVKLDRLAAEVGAMAMTMPAALDDPDALEALCAGAAVVVNCAG